MKTYIILRDHFKNTTFVCRVLVFFLASLCSGGLVFGQSLEIKEILIPVSSQSADARNEAFQGAIESLSVELANSRLGKEFMGENKKRFGSEVLSKSSKYILSVRGKGFVEKAGSTPGTHLKVELSYSTDSFDRVLRESGLVQLSRQKIRALLFLEDKDQAVGTGPWWTKSKGDLKPAVQDLYKLIASSLVSRGIEVVSIASVRQNLSAELKKASLAREELLRAGEQLGASLVFFGLISPSAKGTIYHGQWVQVPAARVLDEVQGEAGEKKLVVEALMEPIKIAQAQGTLNTKPFRLTIKGSLSPRQLESLKSQMRSGVRDLRSIKERLIRQGEFTFEAESPQTPSALADIIKTLTFQDFQHKVSLEGDDEILLQVKKR